MSESGGPKSTRADEKVGAIRERAMDFLADMSIHAERLGSAAEKLGLTPDLVDGIGDQLYEATIAQLDLISKILERSQAIADRLVEAGAKRVERSRFIRLDVTAGEVGYLRFVVRNSSARSASVEVEAEWDAPDPLSFKVGRPILPGGRETSVEICIPPASLQAGQVYAGTVRVLLAYEELRRVELLRREFEIWVKDHE